MKRDAVPIQSNRQEFPGERRNSRPSLILQDKTIDWMMEDLVAFETNRWGIVAAAWKAGTSLFSEDAGELLGRNLPDYLEDSGTPGFKALFREAVREKAEKIVEMRIILKNRSRWAAVKVRPFGTGRKTLVSVMIQNIYEKKHLEQELARQQALFNHVEEATQAGSWELDVPTGMVKGSLRFRLMAGLLPASSHSPVHYSELLERLAPEFREAAVERMTWSAATGKPSECEAIYLSPRGRRVLYCRSVPLRDAEGQVTKIVGSVRDITEAKEREQELERHRVFTHEAMWLAKIGAWEWNSATNEVMWSPEMYQLLGLDPSRDRMTSEWFEQIRDPRDRELADEQNREAFLTGKSIERVIRVVCPDGTRRVWRTRAVPARDAQGKSILLRGVCQDITEQAEAEEQLRESQEQLQKLSAQLIQTSDQERRRIARILHETAAQSLAGLKMTISNFYRQLPDKQGEAGELARSALDLCGQTLQELRTVSHLMHPPLLDLAGLIPALQRYADGFSARSGIAVTLEMTDKFRRLNSDVETTVFRIVQEGLTNVHRHSESSRAVVRVTLEDHHLHLEVQDFGRGMDFRGAARGDKPNQEGGVGLAGIRERVRLLGGEFQMLSERGEGTVLRATLPVKNLAEEEAPNIAP